MENYELQKTVNRLTLNQANEASFAEIDEIYENGLEKDDKAKLEEENKVMSASE